MLVLTIGHSARTLSEFTAILNAHGVERLVDVRTIPRSRTNPQFNRETLADELREAGIEYAHMPELGGLRRARPDSPNTGWRNAGFRAYADHMQTAEWRSGLEQLIEMARDKQVAVMCAEAVPWRCHRSLIGDALVVRGIAVEDIMTLTKRQPHRLAGFAKVEGDRLTYPAKP